MVILSVFSIGVILYSMIARTSSDGHFRHFMDILSAHVGGKEWALRVAANHESGLFSAPSNTSFCCLTALEGAL
jgi:hypothetical protein